MLPEVKGISNTLTSQTFEALTVSQPTSYQYS